ncbi:hypothetical protein DOTSEDRAFT_72330 [Dothistroma septosporum NZE10]|uniref:Phospholipase/carboxylesterase/thioesterase domain-containing protein n=1 Tax=Dothistroma septosporum (strain NZE10 / CBS 128990) TaxID=675120 RepID=M2YLG2_DOTSN|nr:hypothetical protein DOTSEDRAFT_72330 [Dothistroma septosporum NZE10]
MGRLPKTDDFSSSIKLNIVSPPGSDAPTNVLVLLHGLGDTHDSFTNLAKQMALPETVGLSIQGPSALLDLGGKHWGDDIIFDSTTGGLDPDAGFKQATKMLKEVVEDVLMGKCGYTPREVVVFGFGQGGMAALELGSSFRDVELGGIISIGAGLPSDSATSLDPKSKTPVLVCAGSDQSAVTSTTEDKLKRVFEHVEVTRYRKPGDTMPANRDEMMPIMQFFSRRLRSTKGVPEGAVEMK